MRGAAAQQDHAHQGRQRNPQKTVPGKKALPRQSVGKQTLRQGKRELQSRGTGIEDRHDQLTAPRSDKAKAGAMGIQIGNVAPAQRGAAASQRAHLTIKSLQRKVFLALLYPSGYNNRWKSFEPQDFSAFVPQHGIFPVGHVQLSV